MKKIKKSILFIIISIVILTCSREENNIKSELLDKNVDCNFTQKDIKESLDFFHKKQVKKLASDKAKVLPVGQRLKIEDIPLLTSLVLKEASIKDADLVYLRPLEKLKELDISWNKGIGDENIGYLLCLEKLESLYLSGTNISDNSLFYISSLENIKFLSLASTITVKGLSNLKGLDNLESISLLHKVSKQDFAVLGKFKSLTSLSLAAIDDKDIVYLTNLKSLKRLVLPQNISPESIELINKELPGSSIIRVFTQSAL